MALSLSRFLDDTHTHAHTLGKTPLDERMARRRDLYLATLKTHMGKTSISPAGFEPAIPGSLAVADNML